MQVDNVSNYKMNSNPNFTSIRSVKTSGMYKWFPEYGKQLADAFQKNPEAMKFCEKYDVDIVFHAFKSGASQVESAIHIIYDNLAKGKARRFFDSLIGSRDKVSLHSWGTHYDVKESLKASTAELVEMILPEGAGLRKNKNGMLTSHLKFADRSVQEVLDKKTQKVAEIEAKKAEKVRAKNRLSANQQELDDAIKNLMDKSN